ncbi:MAG: hypothetical protein EA379_02315 [Phycisphaerales bacterium]|nr:MAG: hypothetical protein EA379_02315 [Phycisphaerales bacterium]
MIVRTIAVIALCSILSIPAAPTAWAQLPQGITARQTMSAEDQRAVRDFAGQHLPALGADDTRQRQRARDALLAPLAGENVSVAFRLELSSALAPGLRSITTGSADEHAVFNACRIAAALATDAGVSILRTALTDERDAVRYAGAYGMRRVMLAAAIGRAPLGGDQEAVILGALADAMRAETEHGVFDGLVSAFEAVGADEQGRLRAMARMCDAASARARTLESQTIADNAEGWARSLLRAVRGAQSTLIDQIRRGTPNRDFAIACAHFSGHALAHTLRRVESAAQLSDGESSSLGELVRTAEVTLLFSDNAVRGLNQQEQPLAAAWPDAARTRSEALKWIGPQGVLTRSPYTFTADTFLPAR